MRGGLVSMGAQAIIFGVSMAGTVVLARLLTPDDYGVVGMVSLVLGFAKMFRDAGLTAATIQQDTLTQEQASSLFWVNTTFVCLVGLAVLASAPLIAAFFSEPRLVAITAVLAVAFIVNGLSLEHDALLKRHMKFGVIATGYVVAQVLSVVAMVACAVVGLAYWSLVVGSCVTAVVTTAISLYMCQWRPGRLRRGQGVRPMLRFGGHVMGFNIANYFSRNADNILIGRYVGADALGLYAKAYSIFLLPLQQVRGPLLDVAMPALSTLRGDPERFARYYRRLVDNLATLAVPLAMVTLVEADFIVRIILGPQWMGAVPVLQLLALVGLVQAADSSRSVVLLSQGMSRRYFAWGLVNAVATIAGFVVGVRWGIVGVAAGYTVVTYALLLPSLFYCFARTPVSVGLFLMAMLPSLVSSAVAGGLAYAVRRVLGTSETWAAVLSCLVFALVYMALALARRSVRQDVRRAAGALRRTDAVRAESGESAADT